MAVTPSAVGRRYLPFVAVAAVQVLLVAVAPSHGLLAGSGSQGSSGDVAAGTPGSQPGDQGNGNSTGSTVLGAVNGTSGAGTASGVGGVGGVGSGGSTGTGLHSTATTSAASAVADMSKCDPKTGKEIGPLTDNPQTNFMMPNCLPVFHGTNGGATMTGVTATEIRYVSFQISGNAQFNAAADSTGLQSNPQQWCQGQQAFNDEINKRWELWGRKLVPMDGPGANSGRANANQGSCTFPYWQSTCPQSGTPPEECYRAEADTIAKMHPAMVLSTTLDPALFDELTRDHVIAVTTATQPFPLSSYQQSAPYFYGAFMDGIRLVTLDAEYWCKVLNNKPAIHAGADVTTTRNWGPAPGVTPTRKLAVVYGEDSDNNNKQLFNLFSKLVSGGPGSMCSSPGGVLEFPAAPDPTTAAQQSVTAVNAMISSHITDVILWTDPLIGPIDFTTQAQSDNYQPEYPEVGWNLEDDNQIGQLYQPSQWAHAFGISELYSPVAGPPPGPESDPTRAYNDAGNAGQPGPDQGLYILPYMFLGDAFMEAGPSPTVDGIHQGLLAMGNNGGWAKLHNPKVAEWGLSQTSPWTFEQDVREVYWVTTRTAAENNQPGSYCPLSGGQRYLPTYIPTGDMSFSEPGC